MTHVDFFSIQVLLLAAFLGLSQWVKNDMCTSTSVYTITSKTEINVFSWPFHSKKFQKRPISIFSLLRQTVWRLPWILIFFENLAHSAAFWGFLIRTFVDAQTCVLMTWPFPVPPPFFDYISFESSYHTLLQNSYKIRNHKLVL